MAHRLLGALCQERFPHDGRGSRIPQRVPGSRHRSRSVFLHSESDSRNRQKILYVSAKRINQRPDNGAPDPVRKNPFPDCGRLGRGMGRTHLRYAAFPGAGQPGQISAAPLSVDEHRLYAEQRQHGYPRLRERRWPGTGGQLPGARLLCNKLTRTWFWRHDDPQTPVTSASHVLEKTDEYFARNVNFLINLSPNTQGKIDDNLAAEFAEIGKRITFPAPVDSF